VDYAFDHPVNDRAWYWEIDRVHLKLSAVQEAELCAETFERSEDLLSRFSVAQIAQGLHYLTSYACSSHMVALVSPAVPEGIRLRALRSFVPLFQNTMRGRCTEHLSYLSEKGRSPLNPECFMWWEHLLPLEPGYMGEDPRLGGDRLLQASFDDEAIRVMATVLEISHDACRESALHGLGHWRHAYPDRITAIIDRFLSSSTAIREDLRDYAEMARTGILP
jgi:hypothetical protein